MLWLLALLLVYLAQNLLTPWPLSFITICAIILGLGIRYFARRLNDEFKLSTPQIWLIAALISALIILWQLFPPPVAAAILMLIAMGLFVYDLQTQQSPALQPIPPTSPTLNNKLQGLFIGLIMLGSLFANTYNNAHLPPGLHGDEAESGIEARAINAGQYSSWIAVGWYDQPLPSFWVQAWGLQIFGDDVRGLRTTSAVVSVLTLPLVYWLTRRLFNARIALFTIGLMAAAHWFIAYARLGINYNQTLFLQVLTLVTFWEGWQRRRAFWFVLSGLATGAGLYLYFASRLVPILIGALCACLWIQHSAPSWTKSLPRPLSWLHRVFTTPSTTQPPLLLRHVLLWFITMVCVFWPMGVFFFEHRQEFNSRTDFVFLFNDAEKMKAYTGSTNPIEVALVQVLRYAALFNAGNDRSGQYGNQTALLDYYTAAFFALGFAYALVHYRQPRFMLLLVWSFLTLGIGGVLTIESPFTPRIIGALPIPFILAAISMDYVWRRLTTDFATAPSQQIARHVGAWTRLARPANWTPALIALIFTVSMLYHNYWVYFERYPNTIDGWAQREIATTVAQYAAEMRNDQTLYVLGAPELFVWHGTIKFLAPQVRGIDLLEPDNDLPIQDINTQNASFVIAPTYVLWLEKLQAVYPNGTLREYRRPWGDFWFMIYEVSADEIAAKRK